MNSSGHGKAKRHKRNALIRHSWDTTRPDLLTAERIEVAIHFQNALGSATAKSYLQQYKIGPEIADRVLSGVFFRRKQKSLVSRWIASQVWRVLRYWVRATRAARPVRSETQSAEEPVRSGRFDSTS